MQLKAFLKTLTIIHTALCGGLMILTILAYYMNRNFTAQMNNRDIFIYIVPIVAAGGYFLSQLVFKKRLIAINKQEKLSIKLGKYQVAAILKYALIEAPGILALLAYFWSGNALYLVVAISLIIYLFAQRPTLDKLIKELPMTYEEQKTFSK